MKKNTLILIAAALLAAGCAEKKSGEPQLKTIEDTLSWIMGESFAQTLPQESFFNLNKELMFEAIRYTLEGREQPIDDTTFNGGMQYIMMQNYAYQKKQTERKRHLADSTQTVFFRNLVATNKNVKQHPAGFYYEVLREGKGPRAKYAQRIRFDYRSFLLDGTAFDQTYGRRDPIIHVIGAPMFPGFIEAFQLMNAGSSYRFYFPYQLLANEETSGSVEAYTPMIYEIELYETYND
ncbi:MAG: FKBP-type peptidyl-prolyl cis-trans isomerase [Bacteroidales bacterium]|nr:FKBP-type peptidyl-prolyl cis-trans isomerase [Bacteroidales bacterium]